MKKGSGFRRALATARITPCCETWPKRWCRRASGFVTGVGEALDLGETFDYVLLLDLVPYASDLQELFAAVARHCHPRTRILVSTYNNAWRPLLALAARLGRRPRRPVRNWVAPRDL